MLAGRACPIKGIVVTIIDINRCQLIIEPNDIVVKKQRYFHICMWHKKVNIHYRYISIVIYNYNTNWLYIFCTYVLTVCIGYLVVVCRSLILFRGCVSRHKESQETHLENCQSDSCAKVLWHVFKWAAFALALAMAMALPLAVAGSLKATSEST